MTTHGESTMAALSQVRGFLEDVGRLLSTAEGLIRKAGWKPFAHQGGAANYAIAEMSYRVDLPRQWMPFYAFRFFEREDAPSIWPFVAVILDDFDAPGQLAEPLLGCGVVVFEEGKGPAQNWIWPFARRILCHPELTADGVLRDLNPTDARWRQHPLRAIVALALPLAEVHDAEHVRGRVVDPLLEVLQQRWTTPAE